jgi:hypothetical protein
VVGQAQAKLGVDLGFVGRVGGAQDAHQVGYGDRDGVDLPFAHACRWRRFCDDLGAQARFQGELPGLDLGDPLTDDRRIAARVECGPVLGEQALALGDLFAEADRLRGRLVIGLGGGKSVDRVREVCRVERAGEPGVQFGDDLYLAKVCGARVADLVGARTGRRASWNTARRVSM